MPLNLNEINYESMPLCDTAKLSKYTGIEKKCKFKLIWKVNINMFNQRKMEVEHQRIY